MYIHDSSWWHQNFDPKGPKVISLSMSPGMPQLLEDTWPTAVTMQPQQANTNWSLTNSLRIKEESGKPPKTGIAD